MEDNEASGRGRGRARGRGRGEEQGDDHQQPPHLRRPGEPGFPSHQVICKCLHLLWFIANHPQFCH